MFSSHRQGGRITYCSIVYIFWSFVIIEPLLKKKNNNHFKTHWWGLLGRNYLVWPRKRDTSAAVFSFYLSMFPPPTPPPPPPPHTGAVAGLLYCSIVCIFGSFEINESVSGCLKIYMSLMRSNWPKLPSLSSKTWHFSCFQFCPYQCFPPYYSAVYFIWLFEIKQPISGHLKIYMSLMRSNWPKLPSLS